MFPLKSVESSVFNKIVQMVHLKTCTTETGYDQILVTIDHFTKLAEAVLVKRPLRKKLAISKLHTGFQDTVVP